MARELGLELAQLQGTGPGGRIVKADVEAAAKGDGAQAAPAEEKAPEAEPEPEEKKAPPAVVSGDAQTGKGETTTQDLTRLQQTVARRMAESKATAPDFILNIDVDMEEAVDLRKRLKAAAGEGQPVPSFNDFVVKAAALALVDFPRANGAYRDGKFELYSRVNVGVAVAGQDALVVPTVFDADSKSLGQIAKESRALAERVRAGAITPPELSSGTFTVSNLGMFGIQSFTAVINPPQAAILAVGAMQPTPVVRDGEVVVRNIMRHHARLRPPDPLRRRRRRVPRPHPRAARESAPAGALTAGQPRTRLVGSSRPRDQGEGFPVSRPHVPASAKRPRISPILTCSAARLRDLGYGSRPVTGASVSSTAPATSSTLSTTWSTVGRTGCGTASTTGVTVSRACATTRRTLTDRSSAAGGGADGEESPPPLSLVPRPPVPVEPEPPSRGVWLAGGDAGGAGADPPAGRGRREPVRRRPSRGEAACRSAAGAVATGTAAVGTSGPLVAATSGVAAGTVTSPALASDRPSMASRTASRPPTRAAAHSAAATSDPPAPRLVMSPRKFTTAGSP